MALGPHNYQNDSEEMIFSWKTTSEGSFSMQHYYKSHWLFLFLLFKPMCKTLGVAPFHRWGRRCFYLLKDARCRQLPLLPDLIYRMLPMLVGKQLRLCQWAPPPSPSAGTGGLKRRRPPSSRTRGLGGMGGVEGSETPKLLTQNNVDNFSESVATLLHRNSYCQVSQVWAKWPPGSSFVFYK